jgi:signal transduction histidine kinase
MSGASRAAPAAVPEPGSGRTASRPAAEPPAELLRQAAIIAHDINNLLTAIGAAAEALKVATSEQDVAQCHADIRAAIAAGAALGRDLAELGRKRRPSRRVRIAPALHQVAPVLRRLCGADVVLVMDVEPGAGSARLDRTGLDRALVNLVRNAAAAMPRGGTVTVRG